MAYAKTTTVAFDKSISEIVALVKRAGAVLRPTEKEK